MLKSLWIRCARVHLAASCSNCIYVEFFDKNADLTKYSDLYRGYREPVDGYLTPSDIPGLGIEIDQEAIEKYRIN